MSRAYRIADVSVGIVAVLGILAAPPLGWYTGAVLSVLSIVTVVLLRRARGGSTALLRFALVLGVAGLVLDLIIAIFLTPVRTVPEAWPAADHVAACFSFSDCTIGSDAGVVTQWRGPKVPGVA